MNKAMILHSGSQCPIKNALLHWKKFEEITICGRSPFGKILAMFNQDFKEFIALLNRNKVRYLVVGGYALALHGHPRYTKDLDVWVECSRKNAGSLLRALSQFGMGSLGLSEGDFLVPDQVVQLGYPPNRIDILLAASGVEFRECYPKRVEILLDGVLVNFIDILSLKKNKKAAGRLQDLADLEHLGG